MKKAICIIMSLVVLIVFGNIAIGSDDSCCGYCSPGNPFNCTTHTLVGHEGDHGNCTWWCAYKRSEVSGPCYGNAVLWLAQARAGGLPTGQMPATGSIAVFDSYYKNSEGHRVNGGHVTYVESVNNDGSFNVTEMGYEAWNCVRTNILNSNSYDGIQGFIFPKENLTYFTFPNHSSQGWTCGSDTQTVEQTQADQDTWMVVANGSNPSVISPSFANGINTNQFRTLKFSARVDGSGSSSSGYIWIKDDNDNWEHGIYFGSVSRDYSYHEYTANLYGSFSNLDISQISIKLTKNGGYENWIFDWVKLISDYYYWDFTDSQLGWTIENMFLNGFYGGYLWEMNPSDNDPKIISPYLGNVNADDYSGLKIRFSVQTNTGLSNSDKKGKVFFSVAGGSFTEANSVSFNEDVVCDGVQRWYTMRLDSNSNWTGEINRIRIDPIVNGLADSSDIIRVDKIEFVDADTDSNFPDGNSGGGIYEPEDLTATTVSASQINLNWNRGLNPPEYANLRYRIYRSVNNSGYYAITTTANTNYSNSGLNSDTQYCYKITAYINDNESYCSDQDCVTTDSNSSSPPTDYTYSTSYICDSWQYGIGDEYWNLQPINVRTEFAFGDTAQFLVKLENVYTNHRFRMKLYHNGLLLCEQTNTWLYPDSSQGWGYSSFTPYQENLVHGNYQAVFYLDIENGFFVLDSKQFNVSGSDYIYIGTTVCEDWEYGSLDYNSPNYWNLQAINPKTEFNVGETVQLLTQLKDVFIDHEWKMELWKYDISQWYCLSGWMDVDNINGWGYSNFTPYLENASAGDYEFKLYLNTGNGFILKDTKPFTVILNNENIPYFEDFSNDNHGFTLEDHLDTASLYISENEGINGSHCLILNNTQTVSSWQIQAKKIGFKLNQGTSYQGEINLKADTPGIIYILIQREIDPWDNMGLWKAVQVTTSWQTININFIATNNPELDPENVRFAIQAGELSGKLYINNISLN